MPDIFISYSREDRPSAAKVAAALEAEGFSVWWDAVLRAGEAYDEVTEDNLRNAGAVVVLWSQRSTRSKWVRAEATMGERHSTLVPADIEVCDRPLRFELIQTADLTSWNGDGSDPNWKGLVADIKAAIARKSGHVSPDASDAADAESIEGVFWSTIKDTDNPAELEAYLKRYRNGRYTDAARARLTAMAKTERAAKPQAQSDVSPDGTAAATVPRQLVAIAIFALTAMAGMAFFVIASAINIGWYSWAPAGGAELLHGGAKEIGFISALNWSVAALFLMPAAWMTIFLAYTELPALWGELTARRMIVTRDFNPVAGGNPGFLRMQKHIRLFVLAGAVAVTAFSVALAMSDYFKVAGKFYADPAQAVRIDRIDAAGYPLSAPDVERDWMVASLLSSSKPDPVDAGANRNFAAAAYVLYVGGGIGTLVAFGLIVIGAGATFMRGVAQNYGLTIIPDLQSEDPRAGFETVRRFFKYAVFVAFIACMLAYLMGVQNFYLRSPHVNIFAFLAPDAGRFGSGSSLVERVDALIGFAFAGELGKGTRNLYVWVFSFFCFGVFIGGFLLFLHQGVAQARDAVRQEIAAHGLNRLQHLTPKDENAIEAQLSTLQVWPLKKPGARQSLAILAALIASLAFYKIGFLIVAALCLAMPLLLTRPDA